MIRSPLPLDDASERGKLERTTARGTRTGKHRRRLPEPGRGSEGGWGEAVGRHSSPSQPGPILGRPGPDLTLPRSLPYRKHLGVATESFSPTILEHLETSRGTHPAHELRQRESTVKRRSSSSQSGRQ